MKKKKTAERKGITTRITNNLRTKKRRMEKRHRQDDLVIFVSKAVTLFV